MQTEFFHSDKRAEAYGRLDEILRSATVMLKGAVCYVTKEGCDLLENNIGRLKTDGSFFIAGYNDTSDIESINRLCRLAPGKIRFHGVAGRGTESKEGTMMPGLMHDKLIYAEGLDGATVWVGSHNLTHNALRGVNIEAAAIISGDRDDPFFRDVRTHLEFVFGESVPGPAPLPIPPPITDPIRDLVLVHCEADAATIEAMRDTAQGFVSIHLRQPSYDRLCIPPANPEKHVRLHLYAPGELGQSGPLAPARLIKAGEIYGVNFTEKSVRRGNKAEWPVMDFIIEEPPGHPFQPLRIGTRNRDHSEDVTICAVRIDDLLAEDDEANKCCALSHEPRCEIKAESIKVDLAPEATRRRKRYIKVIKKLHPTAVLSGIDFRSAGAKLHSLYEAKGGAFTSEAEDAPFRFIHNGQLFKIGEEEA